MTTRTSQLRLSRSGIFGRIGILILSLSLVSGACAADVEETDATAERDRGLGHKILFYLPNRLLDFVDIFRFRLKAGPGLSASLRATEPLSFYVGEHDTFFVGLSGPRRSVSNWRPWGREQAKGIIFFGIDATDDTPYLPEHSRVDLNVGAHLGFVGADAGVCPLEIVDFFGGLIGRDLSGDDL